MDMFSKGFKMFLIENNGDLHVIKNPVTSQSPDQEFICDVSGKKIIKAPKSIVYTTIF